MEADWDVGEVLASLEKAGRADNTPVIFTSDNGCPACGLRGEGSGGKYAARPGNWKLVRPGKQPEVLAKPLAAVAKWEIGTVVPAFEPQRFQQAKKAAEEKAEAMPQ